jgi:aspartate/methionine/tyrosine aminotransferase
MTIQESRPPAVSARLASLQPSATVEMTERVRAARAKGRPVIGLSSGDPNIPTDPRIVAAAEQALHAGRTHYSAPAGELTLRDAIAAREKVRGGADFHAEDVLVTPGGKFALLAALMAIVDPGDEVLIPEPGWVSYAPCVRLCGGMPIPFSTMNLIDQESFGRLFGPKTKAMIVNSPVNPTGRIISRDELISIGRISYENAAYIVFDQVYADLTHDTTMVFPQGGIVDSGRLFIIDSLSKSFGMTGWRLGYMIPPKEFVRPVLKFIQHSIYCVPAFIQLAGVRALELSDEVVPLYRSTFRNRLDRAVHRLSTVPGMSCHVPDAAFYLFPAIDGDDVATARTWLDQWDVAVLPGSAFGQAGKGHLRLSLAASDEEIDEALDRINAAGIVR